MKHPVLFIIPLLLCVLCQFDGNTYNPDDPDYAPPSFSIDVSTSNVKGSDTILTDTLRIVLIGNDEERHYNLFRSSLDGSDWSDWGGEGEKKYTIGYAGISGGSHTITIEYCYKDQTDRAKDSTITFFRAIKPTITAMTDTLFAVNEGVPCTLWVEAEGTGELSYEWYRNDDNIDAATDDSLMLDTVSVEDTAHRWHCRVTNPWGELTSPKIRLRILFRVFYNGNESTAGEVPEDTNRYATDDNVTVPGNPGDLSRRGYTFDGWNMKPDGSGVSPDSGLKFEIGTESVTLYAMWQPNDSFTVAYNGNGSDGGEVGAPEHTYKTGELVAVAGNSGDLRREGYTFIGWNTQANDSGKTYVENDTFEMGEEAITLYARWTDNPTWKVTYNANSADSGDVPEDTNEYEKGDTVTVASNSGSLTKEGNTFVGWNTEPEGDDGTFYTPGETFLMGTEPIKLYARWTTKSTYTLTYMGNGNTSGTPPDAIKNEAGVEIKIAASGSLVRKGYSFVAWDTQADTSGKEYKENASYTISENHDTLYAQWDINLYTVTYDGNCSGAENVPNPTTREYAMVFSLSGDIPTCIGHTFTTWKTERGVDYDPGDQFKLPDAHVTLYADWTVNEYATVYNGNGGSGDAPKPDTTNYHDSVTIAGKKDLVLTGYTFTGWNTKADGSGVWYPANTTILMGADNLTLYAQWGINRYKVTFDSRGGTPATTDTTVDYNNLIVAPTAPTRTGHIFDTWYKDTAYTAEWSFTEDTVREDVTLYAKWVQAYTVTFNTQGGSAVSQQTISNGSHVQTPASPTLNSCTFGGWYREPQCFNAWDFGTEVIVSDTTLYAGYTVVDADGNVYNTVLIGSQRWMAENLRVTKYSDGAEIPEVTDANEWANLTTAGYCWYGNGTDPAERQKWGALYNWYTVNGGKLAPEGWHVPGDAEWSTLETYLGGSSAAGAKMKEAGTAHWNAPNTGATNSTGFSAYPGGDRYITGAFNGSGNIGYWWSANSYTTDSAYHRYLTFNSTSFLSDRNFMRRGFSIRCVLGEATHFNVSFNAQGGTNVLSQFVPRGTTTTPPEQPIRTSSYQFTGWFKEPACSNEWDFGTEAVNGPVTLYAGWVIITYPVTYDANGANSGTAPEAQVEMESVGRTNGEMKFAGRAMHRVTSRCGRRLYQDQPL